MLALRRVLTPSLARLAVRARPATRGRVGAALSSASAPAVKDDDAAWEAAFIAATDHLDGASPHEESAAHLRALVRSGLLRHTDLRDNPARFFKAHRLLARHAVKHGPGCVPVPFLLDRHRVVVS